MATFNYKAVSKCHDRLQKAKEALRDCRNASSERQFTSRWADFLIHGGSVINAVEAGAGRTPQGRQWYGGIKRASRADPLTRYMFQARNAEEHDVEPTAQIEGPSLGIGGAGHDVHLRSLFIGENFWQDPVANVQGKFRDLQTGKMPTVAFNKGGPKL